MDRKASNNYWSNEGHEPLREYSRGQELTNNLPYIAMIILGATTFILGFENPIWGWSAAITYLIYGVAGALWIIIFMCPYCSRWNTSNCPCGYGRIAARLSKKKDSNRFKEKFKKHIPVIVPLWFIPIVAGIAFAIRSFSWSLFILLIVFALEAFIVLPLFSTKHSCVNCPQKDLCPWIERRS